MSLALVPSRALLGLDAPAVTVEVHLANGLPGFTLVGLADTEVKEARERVRSAIQNSGLEFPANKRITVNLAPADLPKDSGRFDLPIALGILAASGQVPAAALHNHVFAGELSLSGSLRPVRGALAMAAALQQQGDAAPLVLPQGSAEEAALVPGVRVDVGRCPDRQSPRLDPGGRPRSAGQRGLRRTRGRNALQPRRQSRARGQALGLRLLPLAGPARSEPLREGHRA